ncbi:unnamed protein product [Amoebophrya sp. A25]|nr:unnamed protein product [Amoebophrya sp. A25]|eukprot:GSA25T00000796001.1
MASTSETASEARFRVLITGTTVVLGYAVVRRLVTNKPGMLENVVDYVAQMFSETTSDERSAQLRQNNRMRRGGIDIKGGGPASINTAEMMPLEGQLCEALAQKLRGLDVCIELLQRQIEDTQDDAKQRLLVADRKGAFKCLSHRKDLNTQLQRLEQRRYLARERIDQLDKTTCDKEVACDLAKATLLNFSMAERMDTSIFLFKLNRFGSTQPLKTRLEERRGWPTLVSQGSLLQRSGAAPSRGASPSIGYQPASPLSAYQRSSLAVGMMNANNGPAPSSAYKYAPSGGDTFANRVSGNRGSTYKYNDNVYVGAAPPGAYDYTSATAPQDENPSAGGVFSANYSMTQQPGYNYEQTLQEESVSPLSFYPAAPVALEAAPTTPAPLSSPMRYSYNFVGEQEQKLNSGASLYPSLDDLSVPVSPLSGPSSPVRLSYNKNTTGATASTQSSSNPPFQPLNTVLQQQLAGLQQQAAFAPSERPLGGSTNDNSQERMYESVHATRSSGSVPNSVYLDDPEFFAQSEEGDVGRYSVADGLGLGFRQDTSSAALLQIPEADQEEEFTAAVATMRSSAVQQRLSNMTTQQVNTMTSTPAGVAVRASANAGNLAAQGLPIQQAPPGLALNQTEDLDEPGSADANASRRPRGRATHITKQHLMELSFAPGPKVPKPQVVENKSSSDGHNEAEYEQMTKSQKRKRKWKKKSRTSSVPARTSQISGESAGAPGVAPRSSSAIGARDNLADGARRSIAAVDHLAAQLDHSGIPSRAESRKSSKVSRVVDGYRAHTTASRTRTSMPVADVEGVVRLSQQVASADFRNQNLDSFSGSNNNKVTELQTPPATPPQRKSQFKNRPTQQADSDLDAAF